MVTGKSFVLIYSIICLFPYFASMIMLLIMSFSTAANITSAIMKGVFAMSKILFCNTFGWLAGSGRGFHPFCTRL